MMKLHVFKYQGAGNDFVILDNRDGAIALTPEQVHRLCDRRFGVGADGLMTLCASDRADFEMHYYNADGPEGTMCGNGGRCLVAFASLMGLTHFDFVACDGPHSAQLLSQQGDCSIVRLKMRDAEPPVSSNPSETTWPSGPTNGAWRQRPGPAAPVRPLRRWPAGCTGKNVSPQMMKMAQNVLNLSFGPWGENWRSISWRRRTDPSTTSG